MDRFAFACVILIGLPGAGKSTSGARLAERLQFDFLDIDKLIEEDEKISVTEIFKRFGEPRFRELETRALEDLRRRRLEAKDPSGLVLAVGGGLPESAHNRALLNELGVVVYLHASIDAILSRIGSDQSRPLLQTDKYAGSGGGDEGASGTDSSKSPGGGDGGAFGTDSSKSPGGGDDSGTDLRRQRLESLLDRRESAYQEAHIMIDTSDLSTEEVVLSILEALKRRSDGVKERC